MVVKCTRLYVIFHLTLIPLVNVWVPYSYVCYSYTVNNMSTLFGVWINYMVFMLSNKGSSDHHIILMFNKLFNVQLNLNVLFRPLYSLRNLLHNLSIWFLCPFLLCRIYHCVWDIVQLIALIWFYMDIYRVDVLFPFHTWPSAI